MLQDQGTLHTGNMVMYSCPLRISSNDCRYGYEDTDDEVLYRLESIGTDSSALSMRRCDGKV